MIQSCNLFLQNFQLWTKMEHIMNPISLQNFHAKLSAADNNGTDECNFSPKLSGHAVGGGGVKITENTGMINPRNILGIFLYLS